MKHAGLMSYFKTFSIQLLQVNLGTVGGLGGMQRGIGFWFCRCYRTAKRAKTEFSDDVTLQVWFCRCYRNGLMSKMSVVCMIENACSWCMSIVHEKEGEEKKTRKNCVGWDLEQGKVTQNEDQRSKRARLLTRFQKGDPEGRRDHFHFDQKFHQKRKKTKMKMLVGKSDRIKKLGVLNRELHIDMGISEAVHSNSLRD